MIQNSHIEHDDDCVSFKPNSTNIIVQGLVCNSSHGISIGSLAQYPGVVDLVENLIIYNNTLSNATDSARIKIWVGLGAVTKPGWIGGGGLGFVRNVTYENFRVDRNDAALKIDQCYGAVNASTCLDFPSTLIMENVLFKDFYGTTSKAGDPTVGSLICSSPDVSQRSPCLLVSRLLTFDIQTCRNVRAENVRINTPSGSTPRWATRNIDRALLDVNGVFVDG